MFEIGDGVTQQIQNSEGFEPYEWLGSARTIQKLLNTKCHL
jgi:hypothetical protein